ncbi:MAG TPA: hypothetical protein DHM90_05510 [Clostridiaceae bacterium]|nr:hypothetical protein [Clostridiaceae bacterium]
MDMDKKMLKEIPVKKFDIGIAALTNLKRTYFINAYVRNKILVMDVYGTSNNLKYRVFQTKIEFVTLEDKKWRQSRFETLIGWYPEPTIIILKDSASVIQKYFDTDKEPMEAISINQAAIRQSQLDNRHKAELDAIDAVMKHVRGVPKDFEKWLNDVALLESRYIIYEYKKKAIMPGRCTHCKSDVLVNKPKHNLPGICPSCKSRVIFKSWGKFNNVMDHGIAQLVQKHPDGVIVREFTVSKTYTRNNSVLSYLERNRSVIGKEINHYAWDVFKQNGPTRWCNGRYWNLDIGPIYTRNIKRELKGTEFQYSGLEEMIKSEHQFRAMTYFEKYQKGPALEYLSKLKLFNLVKVIVGPVSSVSGVNLQGKNPLDVLKINKNNLNRAISIDANHNELKLLQLSETEAVSIPDELIKEIARDYAYHLEDFLKISKLSTIHQLMKYIKKKNVRFSDYRDYINMATKLNWNISDQFILFPRHFKQAHDQAQSLVKVKASYEENLIIKKMYEDFNKQLSFTTEEYSIRLPMSAKEVIREGHKLHHCISNYIKRISRRQTLILFIRKKDDPYTPYYTLQLNPDDYKVIQVRGYDNCNPDENINKLLEKYKKNLNKIKVNIAC